MEVKENSANSGSLLKRAYQFWENIKAEFSKIQWTDGEEAKVYAKIVVASTFALGIILYTADIIVQKTVHGIDVIFRLIFG